MPPAVMSTSTQSSAATFPGTRALVLSRILTLLLIAASGFTQLGAVPAPDQTEEKLSAERAALDTEKEQAASRLATARHGGSAEAARDAASELARLEHLEFLTVQKLGVLRQRAELEASAAQLAESRGGAENPANFAQLDSLRDTLIAEQERLKGTYLAVERSTQVRDMSRREQAAAESARRKAKELLETEREKAARAQVEQTLRFAVLEEREASSTAELRELELQNELLRRDVATRRTQMLQESVAAGAVQNKLSEQDLAEQFRLLDEQSVALGSRLQAAKESLVTCEATLAASESESLQAGVAPSAAAVGAARERHRVARDLAQQELESIGSEQSLVNDLRNIWARRFELENRSVAPQQRDIWISDVTTQEALTSDRAKEHTAAYAQVRRDLTALEGRLQAAAGDADLSRWLSEERTDLQKLLALHSAQIDRYEGVLTLLGKLRADLGMGRSRFSLGAVASLIRQPVETIWGYELFAVDEHPITVHKVVIALMLVLAGGVLSRRISGALSRRLLRRTAVSSGGAAAIESLLFYFLLIAVVLVALQLVHVPLTVFTFLGGAVAIGVGFGSQNLLNNFLSGLILLLERPVRVGDLIEIDNRQGCVRQIGARSTRIRTDDGVDLVVPNSKFLEQHVVNWTLGDATIKASVSVNIAYDADPDRVEALLLLIAQETSAVLTEPPPRVQISQFGDSAVEYRLSVWTRVSELKDLTALQSALRLAILKRCRTECIEIPYVRREVTLRQSAPLDVRVSGRDERAK